MPVRSRGPERKVVLRDLLFWAKKELRVLGVLEAQTSAEWLLQELTGLERAELYLGSKRLIPSEKVSRYRVLVAKRKRRMPLPYIIRKAYFWNEELSVGPGCLIPRPETEILVESFIENSGFKSGDVFTFLDLASGSGAIGIALLRHFSAAYGTFSDISKQALALTKQNLKRYKLTGRSKVIVSDLFESLKNRKWDAILCNPPYLSKRDWGKVEPELLMEPRLALDGGSDGLRFYRRIAEKAADYLNSGGWLVLEVGIRQAKIVSAELKEKGFNGIQIYKDNSGIDRVIMARRMLHG